MASKTPIPNPVAPKTATFDSHIRGFFITTSIVTVAAMSLAALFSVFSTISTPVDYASAQGTPSDPGAGPVELPSGNNTGGTPGNGSGGGSNSGGSNGGSTGSGSNNGSGSGSNTGSGNTGGSNSGAPEVESPEVPGINFEEIPINDSGDGPVVEDPVTPPSENNPSPVTQPTPQPVPNQQAITSVTNSQTPTPRSGGLPFISAGLAVAALIAWYYYYSQYGNTKHILKMEEKKIASASKRKK